LALGMPSLITIFCCNNNDERRTLARVSSHMHGVRSHSHIHHIHGSRKRQKQE
jgi:hypothetical protein